LWSLQFAPNGKRAGNVTTDLGVFRDIVFVGSLRVCEKYVSTLKQKDVNTFINKHEFGGGGGRQNTVILEFQEVRGERQ
jgi:hypothetical protein